jgi:exodeoxyribonuclease (lambda-induced)
MEQRTDEWFKARLGKVTASKIHDIMIKTKTGESTYKTKYRLQLVTERLTGKVVPVFMNNAMAHGVEYEDEAKLEYANRNKLLVGTDLTDVGMIDHPSIDWSGASPDGMVGNEGLIEIKCPQPITHTTTIETGEISKRYIHQMQWQMSCTGRQWCDFVSYHPDFPDDLKLFVKRVPRDNELIARLEEAVSTFVQEVDFKIKTIKENLNG